MLAPGLRLSPAGLTLLLSLLAACGGGGGGGGGGEPPLGPRFLHVATADVSFASSTRLSHPDLDGDPSRRIWVTPVLDPEGVATPANPHPICVAYDAGSWVILNADAGSMPTNTAFFVWIDGKFPSFTHSATDANRSDNWTRIEDPAAGGAAATLFVTQHLNAVGGTTLNASEIGVYRFAGSWRVFNQDSASMPLGADFLVAVPTVGSFVHHATADNTVLDFTFVSHPDLPRDGSAQLQVTSNWNPDDAGVYNDHPVAVRFRSAEGLWTIVNTDGAPIPVGASFNVWVTP